MENFQTKLSRESFTRYECKYPSNMVIVEMPPEKDLLTKSGVKINFNPDTLYGEGSGSHVADVCPVMGVVVKVVDRLYFSRRHVEKSMSWETEMELKVGDTIWSHPLAMKNCDEILVEGTLYKCLNYEDIFLAKRKLTWIHPTTKEEVPFDFIVMLNGNVLLEEVMLPRLSEFDISDTTPDKTRGIVAFNGSDVRRYHAKEVCDMPNLAKGDLVAIQKDAYVYHLERSVYNSHFDNGKQYICIQKKYIEAVL